eukprot:5524284-Amphidinium_carterae.1
MLKSSQQDKIEICWTAEAARALAEEEEEEGGEGAAGSTSRECTRGQLPSKELRVIVHTSSDFAVGGASVSLFHPRWFARK